MAEAVSDVAAIMDRRTLEGYLRSRPIDEAQVLALRCALRVMPLMRGKGRRLTLAAFQTVLFSWSASIFSSYRKTFAAAVPRPTGGSTRAAPSAVVQDPGGPARSAARSAARAAGSPDAAAAAYAAAHAAARSADAAYAAGASAVAHAAVWVFVRTDLTYMRETSAASCLVQPLWPEGRQPEFVPEWEAALRTALDAFGPDWNVIYDFYHSLRDGHPPFANLGDQAVAIMLALAEEERFWTREPGSVMRDLAETLGTRAAHQQSEAIPSKGSEQVDFFISYSTENEAEAREVNGYLERAGYSTFVQFKDFAVGSNFVTEMQKGLEAQRLVALLSPAYVASKQCQAEWNAAYNRDPSGDLRYLVPILVEKTELPPLAKQVVYKSLIGLSGDNRRKAVLEAIGRLRRAEVSGIRSPYEFELTSKQTITAFAGAMNTISVLPSRDPADALRRLELARDLANNLIAGLMDSRFQVGRHYIKELENYRDRLPLGATESIYSADAALRNLRDDLENDIRHGICDRFAPRLQRLIEAHYALRVYFPELLDFYDDVKQARQAEPLPLEALSELRRIVKKHTPEVFEPSVDEAFGHAVDVARPATEKQAASSDGDALSSANGTLPPDPIAGVDPVRAAQHAEMSMQNRIWAVLRRVEEGGKTVERVDKALSSYAKWIDPILDWLSKSG